MFCLIHTAALWKRWALFCFLEEKNISMYKLSNFSTSYSCYRSQSGLGVRTSDSRTHTHNHYSYGAYNLELNFCSIWNSEVCLPVSFSIFFYRFFFKILSPTSTFFFLFFSFTSYMPLLDCSLIPFNFRFWDNFITASWASAPLICLITVPLLINCVDAEMQVPNQ